MDMIQKAFKDCAKNNLPLSEILLPICNHY